MKLDLNLQFGSNEIAGIFKFLIKKEDETEQRHTYSETFPKKDLTSILPEDFNEVL